MTGIEKARQLFRDAGLGFPTIPEEFAVRLKELRHWLFSTRLISVSPYNFQHYVHEAERTQIEDYALLSHSGHGVNSYAIHYYLLQGPLHMFLQLAWGGVYMDAKAAAAEIHDCFSLADQVVTAAQEVGKFQAGERLIIVGSDFSGSYWLRPGKNRRWQDVGRNNPLDLKPLEVLTEALGWLTSRRGGKRSEEGTTMPIPRINSLLIPVLRIVSDESGHSVEDIRKGVKDQFKLTDEQTKETHPKSGMNVFENHVAWALAHLVMGKAITPERTGFYKITERGLAILNGNLRELTIKELHSGHG